ncbi:hypothetical protein PENTCL1PPCAC_21166, partial [Pristionchus entomophagus]
LILAGIVMLRALVFFTILHFVRCSCPSGFELVRDGQCRGKYEALHMDFEVAFDTVVVKCKEIDGLPIIIHNEEEQSYWQLWQDNGTRPYWLAPIGLTCNTETDLWEWADGSPLDFKPQYFDGDLNRGCMPHCSWFIYPGPDGGRWTMICGIADPLYTPNIMCTTQLSIPPGYDCGGFEDDSEDGVCYQIGATAESWQEAQMSCRSVGADLASIHNAQENSFVRRLAISKGAVNGVFLGATVSGKDIEFGWIDGSRWDYQNFYSGFPMAGFGQCLAMDTSTTSGQWMNRDCSTKLPVACISKGVTPVPTCNTGPYQEGQVITSPGYPYNASMPCDFFLMVDEGKKVELEIISLEANSCCDFLIIYDDYLGGNMIANLTGEITNATFTTDNHFMRVSWQPEGGVNVRGMAMEFRAV